MITWTTAVDPGAHPGTGMRPNGTTFPAELTIGPLAGEDGPGGGVAIVRDLTLLQETTAERERFERQMAQSEKMLAIGRVVSGVAHELNNPLAVVLGESEHLTDLPVDVEARESIRLINEQAHRARHIVRDLLAFVRPGDDRAEPLDLGALVEHVVAVQAPRAVAHGATIDVHNTTPKDFLVRVDRVGMEQVITNLLENAIDAGGAGATVTVRVVDRGATCLVTVEDTGPGVDPAHLDRIFEPFFTTKGVGHGTGLGLPVSLGLVERHGGTLRLENRPGPPIGARFIVTLPRCEDQLPAVVEAPPARTECAPPRHPGSGQPMPVLVVDDEPAVRSTIARIFSRWGWPVVEVASGEAALQHLAERDAAEWPAVIMCDLRMPGMSGQGVHAALVADFPALVNRVVFVTGDVVEPMTAAFLRAAGRPVVEKPFTMAEMAGAVGRALEGS
jgi:signal transduction histidine kinase